MKVIIDADACPRIAKDILYRTTDRLKVDLLIVANQYIRTPPMHHIKNVVVGEGYNVADDKIVELVSENDLVITSDIPLADRVIKKMGTVLTPHGEILDEINISTRLGVRDLLDDLRSCGMETGGPSPYSQRDRNAFVNALDRLLTKLLKS